MDARVGTGDARPQPHIEDKESARWLDGCEAAAELFEEAASVTMLRIGKRHLSALHRKPAKLDLIVRAAQDRKLADGGRLFAALAMPPTDLHFRQGGARGPGTKGRTAKVALRAGRVRIARPDTVRRDDAPEEIELTLVEAREIDARR